MQTNRTVALVLFLLLATGLVVSWRLLAGGEIAAPPGAGGPPQAEQREGPGAGETGSVVTAADGTADDAAMREAVVVAGPDTSGLPAIVGQVVGGNGAPIAGAEVICMPNLPFGGDFDFGDFDPTDADLFDPRAMAERFRGVSGQRLSVRTDDEGRFRLRPEGTSAKVGLRVLARGYRVLERRVDRPDATDTDAGLLTLTAGAVIAGRVLDVAGKPVAGASVGLAREAERNLPVGFELRFPGMELLENLQPGQTSVTDAEGRFELAHAEAGEITLRARHEEHPTTTRTGLAVAVGQSLLDVLLTMARGAEIRGTVLGLPAGASDLRVMAAAKPKASGEAAGPLGMSPRRRTCSATWAWRSANASRRSPRTAASSCAGSAPTRSIDCGSGAKRAASRARASAANASRRRRARSACSSATSRASRCSSSSSMPRPASRSNRCGSATSCAAAAASAT
jgi:hypothetical protein